MSIARPRSSNWRLWRVRSAWTVSRPTAAQKPEDIAAAALDYARKHYHDVLIVDTAGRLAIDEAMMQEIRRLHEVLSTGRNVVRGGCDAGSGCGQCGEGFFGGVAADRHRPDQARWRCARRCCAVGATGNRPADQICRRIGEALRSGTISSRAAVGAHPGHGGCAWRWWRKRAAMSIIDEAEKLASKGQVRKRVRSR